MNTSQNSVDKNIFSSSNVNLELVNEHEAHICIWLLFFFCLLDKQLKHIQRRKLYFMLSNTDMFK